MSGILFFIIASCEPLNCHQTHQIRDIGGYLLSLSPPRMRFCQFVEDTCNNDMINLDNKSSTIAVQLQSITSAIH